MAFQPGHHITAQTLTFMKCTYLVMMKLKGARTIYLWSNIHNGIDAWTWPPFCTLSKKMQCHPALNVNSWIMQQVMRYALFNIKGEYDRCCYFWIGRHILINMCIDLAASVNITSIIFHFSWLSLYPRVVCVFPGSHPHIMQLSGYMQLPIIMMIAGRDRGLWAPWL